MLEWLSQYWGSLLIGAIVVGIVAVIVWRIVRNRRAGKTVCGSDCANCPGCCACHPAPEKTAKKTSQ